MREPSEILSNAAGLAVIAGLWSALAYIAPAAPEVPPQPGHVEISLEGPQEVKQEEPKQESAAAAAPAPPLQEPTPPEPPVPPPPPPPPPPPEPPEPAQAVEPPSAAKQEEPLKQAGPLLDPDGEAAAQERERRAEAEKNASALRACLQKKARYPTSKEALKLRPHGTVVVNVHFAGSAIASVEIAKSSGSQILDDAAKASVLNSGCGLPGEIGTVSGTFVY